MGTIPARYGARDAPLLRVRRVDGLQRQSARDLVLVRRVVPAPRRPTRGRYTQGELRLLKIQGLPKYANDTRIIGILEETLLNFKCFKYYLNTT